MSKGSKITGRNPSVSKMMPVPLKVIWSAGLKDNNAFLQTVLKYSHYDITTMTPLKQSSGLMRQEMLRVMSMLFLIFSLLFAGNYPKISVTELEKTEWQCSEVMLNVKVTLKNVWR